MTSDVFNQIYFNSTVFNTRQLHSNNLLNMKSKNKLLPQFYLKKIREIGPKSQSTTKHHMFRATNLRQSREVYTNAVGDVGDI